MNTYRVYVLDTANALEPVAHVAYVKGDKYGDAWSTARAALNGSREDAKLYLDVNTKDVAKFPKGSVVAKIDDIKPRNKKLDKVALTAIINDPKASPEDKVKALAQMIR